MSSGPLELTDRRPSPGELLVRVIAHDVPTDLEAERVHGAAVLQM